MDSGLAASTQDTGYPPNPIFCRFDGGVVVIDLGGDGHSEMLFLTRAEATALAENLEPELIGAEGDQIIVADVPLTRREAWQLVDSIERALGDTGYVKVMIDWRAEGF